ncbi:MAG: DUF3293 domain-containing protein [Thermoanaerobaculia bacterium]
MKQEELLAAYARAVYRVDAAPEPIFLRVGEASPELERWLAARGARRFAFLSAANPGSVALADDENRRRHQRLLARLQGCGLPAIAGESYEAAGLGWREASLLVVGLERAAAIALARELGQVALLVGEAGGPVELVLTSAAPEKS